MSGWYWLLWAGLTVVNVLVLLATRWNLRATVRLIDDLTAARRAATPADSTRAVGHE